MTRKQKRLAVIFGGLVILGGAVGLTLSALRESMVFFRSPSEIAEQAPPAGKRIRIGGLVQDGSVKREANAEVIFAVTDTKSTITVRYMGLLPDLFREGQGVVAEGVLDGDGVFRADTVLAKHDENYMPAEVVDALKKQGVWQQGDAMPATGGVKAQ